MRGIAAAAGAAAAKNAVPAAQQRYGVWRDRRVYRDRAIKLARQMGGRYSEDTIIGGEPHFVVWKDGVPVQAFPHVEDLASRPELTSFDAQLAKDPAPLQERTRRRLPAPRLAARSRRRGRPGPQAQRALARHLAGPHREPRHGREVLGRADAHLDHEPRRQPLARAGTASSPAVPSRRTFADRRVNPHGLRRLQRSCTRPPAGIERTRSVRASVPSANAAQRKETRAGTSTTLASRARAVLVDAVARLVARALMPLADRRRRSRRRPRHPSPSASTAGGGSAGIDGDQLDRLAARQRVLGVGQHAIGAWPAVDGVHAAAAHVDHVVAAAARRSRSRPSPPVRMSFCGRPASGSRRRRCAAAERAVVGAPLSEIAMPPAATRGKVEQVDAGAADHGVVAVEPEEHVVAVLAAQHVRARPPPVSRSSPGPAEDARRRSGPPMIVSSPAAVLNSVGRLPSKGSAGAGGVDLVVAVGGREAQQRRRARR